MQHDPALAEILSTQWQRLVRAAADPGEDWHWPTLATQSHDGPDARTVVLRDCDPAARTLAVHSAAGTGKLVQLAALPRACLVFNDRAARTQLRAYAQATLVPRDAHAWAALGARSRTLYRRGLEDFVLIALRVDALDWLELCEPEHRRARFEWAHLLPHVDATPPAVRARWIDP